MDIARFQARRTKTNSKIYESPMTEPVTITMPELRCPNCDRMLARGRVESPLEVQCRRCRGVVAFLPGGRAIMIRPGTKKR